jgi:AcrR family transcriptional regulator
MAGKIAHSAQKCNACIFALRATFRYDDKAMGHRERKKEQTRLAIEDAALRLFAERGFAATTISDIAAAADIAPRTFFAYFPSKEDVVFAHFDEYAASLQQRLDARAPDETTFDALRSWTADLIEATDPQEREHDAIRKQLTCDNEGLEAHERHLMSRFEAVIAASVAADLGDEPDGLGPRLVAAAAIAALTSLDSPEPKDRGAPPSDEELAVLDEAFVFLQGGIAALQERRAATSAISGE